MSEHIPCVFGQCLLLGAVIAQWECRDLNPARNDGESILYSKVGAKTSGHLRGFVTYSVKKCFALNDGHLVADPDGPRGALEVASR